MMNIIRAGYRRYNQIQVLCQPRLLSGEIALQSSSADDSPIFTRWSPSHLSASPSIPAKPLPKTAPKGIRLASTVAFSQSSTNSTSTSATSITSVNSGLSTSSLTSSLASYSSPASLTTSSSSPVDNRSLDPQRPDGSGPSDSHQPNRRRLPQAGLSQKSLPPPIKPRQLRAYASRTLASSYSSSTKPSRPARRATSCLAWSLGPGPGAEWAVEVSELTAAGAVAINSGPVLASPGSPSLGTVFNSSSSPSSSSSSHVISSPSLTASSDLTQTKLVSLQRLGSMVKVIGTARCHILRYNKFDWQDAEAMGDTVKPPAASVTCLQG
ncbi:unnamed protein product [Protopolystoma xenopodis]|uniref:Uncharacterized protein n=1 Tax=Protopolystoma xenopodis TaxID=117903 RepID=A0A3S5AYI8_9PLAT|nr:unnamed protein product [Protopolystoma xenopodis]